MECTEQTLAVLHPQGHTFPAYSARARAHGEAAPPVVIVSEIWGLDHHMRDVARRLAAAGYAAICPDMFAAASGSRPAALSEDRVAALRPLLDRLPIAAWRDPAAREAALAALPEAARQPMADTLAAVLPSVRPVDAWVGHLAATVAHARTFAPTFDAVMVMGFCIGGAVVARAAAEVPGVGAGIIFYGSGVAAERASHVHCPLLALHGGEDHPLVEALPAFVESMRAATKSLESHVYPGAPHAFFNDTRPSFRPQAARQAWARALAFLALHADGPGHPPP